MASLRTTETAVGRVPGESKDSGTDLEKRRIEGTPEATQTRKAMTE